MQTMSIPKYDQLVINVPHVEMKKFAQIAKIFGITIEKQSSMDRALAQVEAGQVYDVESLDELIKIVG